MAAACRHGSLSRGSGPTAHGACAAGRQGGSHAGGRSGVQLAQGAARAAALNPPVPGQGFGDRAGGGGASKGRPGGFRPKAPSINLPSFPTVAAPKEAAAPPQQQGDQVATRVWPLGRRKGRGDSDLAKERALPLPPTYPDSKPRPAEKVADMLSCDPELEDCKTPLYQWTDQCTRCQGTGLVEYMRKRREIISTCIACSGVGYVQRFTFRDDIPVMEDIDRKAQ